MDKVLNGWGVLMALHLSQQSNVPVGKVIDLLNETGKED